MTVFCTPHWQAILKENQLDSFDALWGLTTPWFEEPNHRRGGWSGVIKIPVQRGTKDFNLFIKRQENHISRTWYHPIRGITTFEKEFSNIQLFNKCKIPTLTVIYFASRTFNNNRQAVLATEELAGYQPLEHVLSDQLIQKKLIRRRLIKAIATLTKKMHQNRLQHNCFYPKHIFVKQENDQWSIKFIDLEKVKSTFTIKAATIRDLITLTVHSPAISPQDQLYFFKCYQNEHKLSQRSRKLLSIISNKVKAKRARSEAKNQARLSDKQP